MLLCRAKGAQKWACGAATFPACPVFLQAYRALPTCQKSDWKVNACKARKHAGSFSSKQVQEWLFCPLTSPWRGSEQGCLPFHSLCTCVAGTPCSLGCVLVRWCFLSGVWAGCHKTPLKTPVTSFLSAFWKEKGGDHPFIYQPFLFLNSNLTESKAGIKEVNKKDASVWWALLPTVLCPVPGWVRWCSSMQEMVAVHHLSSSASLFSLFCTNLHVVKLQEIPIFPHGPSEHPFFWSMSPAQEIFIECWLKGDQFWILWKLAVTKRSQLSQALSAVVSEADN